jgi:ATP-dependent Clp protease ATP-binding subunit ClpX
MVDHLSRCAFCGVPQSAEVPLIAGAEGHICAACVELAHQVVTNWGRGARLESSVCVHAAATPATILARLDRYVIGQQNAKETSAVAVYNHHKRISSCSPGTG